MFVLLIYIILFPFTLNATNGDKPKLKFIGQGNEAPYFFTTSDNAPTGFTSELIDILMHDSDYEYSIETLSREDYRTFIRKINSKELPYNLYKLHRKALTNRTGCFGAATHKFQASTKGVKAPRALVRVALKLHSLE